MVLAGTTVETSAVVPPSFPASNFRPSFSDINGFPLLLKKYEQCICTEATKPYLYDTLNQINVILYDH